MNQYRTLLTPDRLEALKAEALCVANMPEGAVAELGVYRGGVARLLAETLPVCDLYLFDTFEGMPQADASIDRHHQGDFADTSLDAVLAYLDDWNRPGRTFARPGLFPASVLPADQDLRFRLVHLDADLYSSTKAGLEWFWPRLVPGGSLILDDWLWHGCPGVEKAVHEFLNTTAQKQIAMPFVELRPAKFQLILRKAV